jgi:hypothetical protein
MSAPDTRSRPAPVPPLVRPQRPPRRRLPGVATLERTPEGQLEAVVLAAGELEPVQRLPPLRDVPRAHAAQHVEDVGGDTVAATLIAREIRTVDQEHPQHGNGVQRA